ncbi:MAG: DUF4115 domain-containing protein [bacterium]|nr:DUF4115 domain-containing protein [bacterium]
MDPLAERLRLARERQGRTLRELSAETKIREPFLEALEGGRYNVLPAVYVRSFIRTAGAALHIPAKEIIALMNEVFDPVDDEVSGSRLPASSQPPMLPETPSPISALLALRPKSLRSPFALAMAILGVVALFVIIWALFLRGSNNTPATTFGGADSVIDVDARRALGLGGSDEGAIAETDSIVLTAQARDTAWLNITSDEKRTQQIVLLPGSEYQWSAMQKFVLSVGNAGAVTFSRNGQTLKPFGKTGEVVRSVTITRKDVKSSATVVRPPSKPAPSPQRPLITPAPRQRVDPKSTNPQNLPRR